MQFHSLPIPGAYHIILETHSDARGSFTRSFCAEAFKAQGLHTNFPQHSMSTNIHKATLRGLHYQHVPYAEVKLIHCTRGRMWDVIVDLRADSNTYLQHAAMELDATAPSLIYIPKGCAHGFITLEDRTDLQYMISTPYVESAQAGLRWDDPKLGIKWPLIPQVISERDRGFALL